MPDAETKPKKRRRLRFTLRMLLIVVTALCLFLGLYVTRSIQQQKLVKWLRDNQSDVFYDFEFNPWGRYNANPGPPGPRWLVEALGVDYFASVYSLKIRADQFRDLTRIASLSSLRRLHLGNAEVTDLSPLPAFGQLQRLTLGNVVDVDLSPVAELEKLEQLHLYIPDSDEFEPLRKLENLKILVLGLNKRSGHQVKDLSPLTGLKGLQQLYLIELDRNIDLGPLAELKNVETLAIHNTPLIDLSALSALTQLREFHLAGSAVSDLRPLHGLTSLEWAAVSDNDNITNEQLQELSQALPNCRVD